MEDKTMLPTIVRRRNYTTPNLFNDLFNDEVLPSFYWKGRNQSQSPAVNVEETEKEYLIEVAAPGLDREDLKVSVENDVLTISAEKKLNENEEKNNFLRREFGYTSFKRSFHLPEETNAEKISANHKNGVLIVRIPKAEAKVQPVKEIKIS